MDSTVFAMYYLEMVLQTIQVDCQQSDFCTSEIIFKYSLQLT